MSAAAGAAVRLRVQRVLGGAALEPPGLPPASVLVVRALSDPLPGRVAARPGDVRPSAEWEGAVRAALAERWRGAARPARGPVPAGADAVFFADTAEMIAAFARDAVAGEVVRWWWRALLRGLPGGPVAALAALWAREARHVPAAVEQLAAGGDAGRVFAALPAPQVARILAAVAAAWEAPALLAAPPRPASGGSSGGGALTTLTTNGEDGQDADRPASSADAAAAPPARGRPPWTGFLPPDAVPRGLAPEPAALLGLCLMLHRAPLVARSGAFVARFVRWRAQAAAPAPAARPSPAAPAPRIDGIARGPSPGPASPHPRIARRMERDASAGAPPAEPTRAEGDAARAEDGASTELHRPNAVSGDTERAVERGDATAAPSAETAETAEVAEDGWAVRVHEAPPEEGRAASAACGVFYLVNVLRSMEFHRALDEHFGVAPVIGGWGWMELAARALLGPRAGGLADDAVWRLLAELDGRAPDEPPGGGFRPPRTTALPAAWIDLFRGAPPSPAPSPPLGLSVDPDLQRFLDLVVPVVRARIGAALAAAGADPEESLETSLFRRIGAVEATRTHVDVHMKLDQATLPVRLAGLDATPGWVPELARVVTFYFA